MFLSLLTRQSLWHLCGVFAVYFPSSVFDLTCPHSSCDLKWHSSVVKFCSPSIDLKNTMCPIKERGVASEMTVILFCPLQIKEYEKLDSEEERLTRSRQIYDAYIMKELLSCSHVRKHLAECTGASQ